jgi:hypothetical protein
LGPGRVKRLAGAWTLKSCLPKRRSAFEFEVIGFGGVTVPRDRDASFFACQDLFAAEVAAIGDDIETPGFPASLSSPWPRSRSATGLCRAANREPKRSDNVLQIRKGRRRLAFETNGLHHFYRIVRPL